MSNIPGTSLWVLEVKTRYAQTILNPRWTAPTHTNPHHDQLKPTSSVLRVQCSAYISGNLYIILTLVWNLFNLDISEPWFKLLLCTSILIGLGFYILLVLSIRNVPALEESATTDVRGLPSLVFIASHVFAWKRVI